MTVGEFKGRFSEALAAVARGETIVVTYGRGKKAAGIFGPPPDGKRKRRLGLRRGRVHVRIGQDWEISDEEFLGA